MAKSATVRAITVTAVCGLPPADYPPAELSLKTKSSYVVQGLYYNSGSSDGFSLPGVEGHDGAGQISYAMSSDSTISVLGTGITGHFEVLQAGHSFTVTFAMFSNPGSCSVQAQVTPSD